MASLEQHRPTPEGGHPRATLPWRGFLSMHARVEDLDPRSAAIVVVFAGALALLVSFPLYLVPILLHQLTHLAQTLPRPDEMAQVVHRVQAAIKHLPRGVQNGITAGLTQANATLKANLAAVVNHVVGFMATVVFSVLNTILFLLGFAVVPVWLFFLFQSGPAQRAAVYRTLPTAMRADAAYLVFQKPAAGFSGNFLIDDGFLAAEGVTDLDRYRVDPSAPLIPDFFVPDDIPLPD